MRFLWIIVIAVAGAATGYLFTRFESTPPFVQTREAATFIGSQEHTQEIRISDDGTGVQSVRVWMQAGDQEFELVNETYSGNLFTGADLLAERSVDVPIRARELGLPDGEARLLIEARDFSWGGNASRVEIPYVVDTKPPRISLHTGLTYVRRGGSELVVYEVGEDSRNHGVALGDYFFRGFAHPKDPGRMVAFYAIPPDSRPDERPKLVADDLSGNRAEVPLSIEVIERSFPEDTIGLSDAFMTQKVAELGITQTNGILSAYLEVNRKMRAENAAQIREICSTSSDDRLWSGAFLQLPGSHVGARFAERRTYKYEGREVDKQMHLGYDLASTAHALALVSNDGVVVFAGPLGIYGKTVIVDHGLGLFSLYGHLSETGVEKGKAVARGDLLGRTGQTGLAGGDHLHFAMMLSGVFVDPLEWFDERWLREHIDPKLSGPVSAPDA
jgi:hypothetical protein